MRRAILLMVVLLLAVAGPAAGGVQHGKTLYGKYCLMCHGANGLAQVPKGIAPSLRNVGALAADFYLTTGYMPLQHVGLQPRRSRLILSHAQIEALIAYVASLGHGPAIPKPDPAKGSVSKGMELFTEHCAGCHQIAAEGGYVTGAVPPPLLRDTATQIAEAVRIGPYVMPRFTTKAISNSELNSLIAYVDYAKHPDDRGGWAIGRVGPVPEGLVTWFIAIAALVGVCMVIGKRVKRES
jgi:quinol---cytochrome-c reductase cytochrome c subunit